MTTLPTAILVLGTLSIAAVAFLAGSLCTLFFATEAARICWRTGTPSWVLADGSCSTCGHRFCVEVQSVPSLSSLREAAPETFGGEG